jgi:hypothetical protein
MSTTEQMSSTIFTVFDKTGLPQFHRTTGFGKQNKKIKI